MKIRRYVLSNNVLQIACITVFDRGSGVTGGDDSDKLLDGRGLQEGGSSSRIV